MPTAVARCGEGVGDLAEVIRAEQARRGDRGDDAASPTPKPCTAAWHDDDVARAAHLRGTGRQIASFV
jgi:hypothetical protein